MDQYESGLLFRASWLMEQKVRTELEHRKYTKEDFISISHTGLVTVDGKEYKFEFRMTKANDMTNTDKTEPAPTFGA